MKFMIVNFIIQNLIKMDFIITENAKLELDDSSPYVVKKVLTKLHIVSASAKQSWNMKFTT